MYSYNHAPDSINSQPGHCCRTHTTNVRENMHAIGEYSRKIADERQMGGRTMTEADDKVEIDSYKKKSLPI